VQFRSQELYTYAKVQLQTTSPARFNYHHIEGNGAEVIHLCLHYLAILYYP